MTDSSRTTVDAGETMTVKREDIAILYALARRPDFADTYTTSDLLADFKAMQAISKRLYFGGQRV